MAAFVVTPGPPNRQVKTLDGRSVWRRRHYRVKRGAKPGTFNFSVSRPPGVRRCPA
jgi:hypothetical protein